MSKAIVEKTKKNVVANYSADDLGEWGENEANQNDVVIPKFIIMQSNSTLVTAGEDIVFGDIIESLGKKVMAGFKKGINIVPFHMKKKFIVKKKVGAEFEFVRFDEVVDEAAPKEFAEGKDAMTRQLTREFYCMVEGSPIPVIVPMKGMSTRTAKILATAMYVQNKVKKLPPPGMTFELTATKELYEGKTNAAYKIVEVGPTPRETVMDCLTWYRMVIAGDVKEAAGEEVVDAPREFADSKTEPIF